MWKNVYFFIILSALIKYQITAQWYFFKQLIDFFSYERLINNPTYLLRLFNSIWLKLQVQHSDSSRNFSFNYLL